MNAITVVQPPHMAVSEIERVAMAIAQGGLFGSKDPNAVLTLCFLAHAEGQHPAVVFRDYHIIQGKPAKKAEAMLRDFITAGGKIEWHTLNDECADATFSHSGGGTVRIDWTLQRAQKAGINTPMWKKYPRAMLRSRVISEGIRTVYPGATSGLYEENELRDIVAEQGGDQGQSQTGEVSPEALEYTPMEPIAGETRTVEEHTFPDGPAKNITALKALQRELWSEIEGCGDSDELEPLLAMDEKKAIMRQLSQVTNPSHMTLWFGDGADNPGLQGLIRRKRAEFEQQPISEAANYLAAG